MSRFCPNCGNERNGRETYCSNCGAYLGDSQSAVKPYNTKTKENVDMGGIIRSIINMFKAIFYWITQKLDALYRKKYGSDYATLSSDEKYNIFYKEIGKSTQFLYWMILGTIVAFLLYGYTQEDSILVIYFLAIIVLALINISYMLIYLYNIIRSNWSDIAIKIIVGLIISFFLIALSAVIPPLAVILLCLTIYKNWKRRAFLDRYKRYTRILLKGFLIIFASQIICGIFEAMAKIATSKLENILLYGIGRMSEEKLMSIASDVIWRISIFEALGLCAIFAGLIIWNKIYCNFYKNEHARGIKYDDCVKLTWLVPLTWFMLAFSYLTLIHSSSFNGDGLLADMDANIDTYMDMDTVADVNVDVADETYTLATDLGDTNYTVHNTFTNTDNSLTTANNDLSLLNNNESNTPAMSNIEPTSISISEPNPIPTTPEIHNDSVLDTSIPDMNPHVQEIDNTPNITNPNNATFNATPPHDSSFAIYDDKGTLETKVVQTNEHTFAIQDSQSMLDGTAHVDSITGDISLHDSLGIRQGTITDDGIIKGVDELTDGRIVTQYDGKRIILDSTNQTIGHILPNGLITNAQGVPLGNIKKC